jgi:hypothetical protein
MVGVGLLVTGLKGGNMKKLFAIVFLSLLMGCDTLDSITMGTGSAVKGTFGIIKDINIHIGIDIPYLNGQDVNVPITPEPMKVMAVQKK